MDPRLFYEDALMLAQARLDEFRCQAARQRSLPHHESAPGVLRHAFGRGLIGVGRALAGEPAHSRH